MAELKLEVLILDAKPNPMFPDWMTERTKFLRFSATIACAECGKRTKHHWTFLASFQAHTMGQLVLHKSGKVHPPLTAVCQQHLLAPEVGEGEASPKKRKAKAS